MRETRGACNGGEAREGEHSVHGSVVASCGAPRVTDYVMSKYTVVGLMRASSVQLAEHGTRVNCVSPNGLAPQMTCRARGMSLEKAQEVYGNYARLQGVVSRSDTWRMPCYFLSLMTRSLSRGMSLGWTEASLIPNRFCFCDVASTNSSSLHNQKR